jgi:hypothetical protein
MRSHDRLPTIAALFIALIIGIFILAVVNRCEAWTEHEFRAALTAGNDWKVSSLPDEISKSEDFDMYGKLGYLSFIYAVREDGKWDKDLMYMGPIAVDVEASRFYARMNINPIMAAMDKILPDERIIVICFLADYGEMDVFFGPDRWPNRAFHEKVAKALNEEREKWIK